MRENGHAVCLSVYSALLAQPFCSGHSLQTLRARRARLSRRKSTPMSSASIGSRSAPTSSRARYFSWVGKKGPTGKERIIYGTYTIYDTSGLQGKSVEKANALEPHDAELEAAASAYVEAVVTLEPLLKEADDYYEQENYKDDRMAKGKALHPRLVAAWDAFAAADKKLRAGIDAIQDKRAAEKLAEIESTEGRKERYHIEALMIRAKRVMRAQKCREARSRQDHGGAQRLRGHRQGNRGVCRGATRAARSARCSSVQRQGVPDDGEAADAARTGQGALQQRRPDDAQSPAAAGWSRARRRGSCATTISWSELQ